MQVESPKVMHFVHWTRSGITSVVKNLCRREAHSLMLLNDDVDFQSEYEEIEYATALQANSRRLVWIWSFFKALHFVRPDILHCHSFMPFVIGSIFALRTKIIFHVHSEYPYLSDDNRRSRLKRFLIKVMIRFRNVALVAVSERSAMLIRQVTGKYCHVLPNGLPDEGSQREPFSRKASTGRFYSVCRLSEEKNLNLALKMLKTVAQRAPHQNLTYDIYGAGPLKTDLEDTIDRLGLRHIVSMKGWCGKPDLLASEYDFYLSTSTFEGFGLSILSGLRGMNVAIITNVGELSKHLCDGKSCFLIDNDEQKASETILKVLSLPEDSLEFVQKNGRDIYISEFGYDAYVSQLKRIYIGHG